MANVLGQLFGDIAGAIRDMTGESPDVKMKPAEFPQKIRGINAGSGDNEVWADASESSGLVGNGIIRYVTFMNYDGTVEYGRKSVIKGENCTDPVTGGFLDTPTRESTPQYDYTYMGWATEPNGGINSNALKTVTEDRTVYANFASVLRYYTITFYDSDGTTVLATKSVAYGSVPSYTAEKEGLVFEGWNPEPVAVTGDASYQAVWSENITFAGGTWEDIVRICDSGKAEEYFALNDTKDFSYTDPDGNTQTATLKIVGFNKETVTGSSETASVTIVALNSAYKTALWTASSGPYYWGTSYIRNVLNNSVLNSFPDALKNGIKSVTKYTRKYVDGTNLTGLETTEDKLWLLSIKERGAATSSGYSIYPEEKGTYYSISSNEFVPDADAGFGVWLRSGHPKAGQPFTAYFDGQKHRTDNSKTNSKYIVFGFCI